MIQKLLEDILDGIPAFQGLYLRRCIRFAPAPSRQQFDYILLCCAQVMLAFQVRDFFDWKIPFLALLLRLRHFLWIANTSFVFGQSGKAVPY